MSETNWSVPETDVLDRARSLLARDERGVLATIIDVEGSAYRRPGAKMLIPEGGEGVGHITAGCLEDEVEGLASEVLAADEPRVVTYDLMPEADDDVWGLGVGCNGVIRILLEPLSTSFRPVLDALAAGDDVGVVTVVEAPDESRVGARAAYDPERAAFEADDDFPVDLAGVEEAVADLTARGRADSITVDDMTLFVDGMRAPDDLVVVGLGHDVGPIVDLGVEADFRVTVLGFRGASAKADRFPNAADVRSTSPARLREAFDFDADTYVVVATHNFVDDRLAVDELLRTDAPYVGLMGPRERFDEMLDDFAAEDRQFSESELARLYTPVGLDLGGGSPHQIALSIVAEALAVKNGRNPGHLKDREGPIHERVTASDGGE